MFTFLRLSESMAMKQQLFWGGWVWGGATWPNSKCFLATYSAIFQVEINAWGVFENHL